MTSRNKAGLAVLAAGSVLAGVFAPMAHAGTGGEANSGIIYGQDTAYCDAQGVTITKTDSLSGAFLEGAVFEASVASEDVDTQAGSSRLSGRPTPVEPQSAVTVGVKKYDADQTDQLKADRVTWQEAFDTAIDDATTLTGFGSSWMAARFMTAEKRVPGANDDADPTEYAGSERLVFPAKLPASLGDADTTGLTSSQSAALRGWVSIPANADNNIATVAQFGQQVKDRLDVLGIVLFFGTENGYDSNNPPAAPTAGDASISEYLVGTDSEAVVIAEYTKQLAYWNLFKETLASAGYANPNLDNGAMDFGTYAAPANYGDFVANYTALTAPNSYSFGLPGMTYDLIYNVAGTQAVKDAEAVANEAVEAVTIGSDQTPSVLAGLETDAEGKIYLGLFGRTIITDGSSMNRSCKHLAVNLTETEAPTGFEIDDEVTAFTPGAAEDFIGNLDITNSPTPPDGEQPEEPADTPEFESGI